MTDRPADPQPAQPAPLYITLILDESCSMQSCRGAALAGFNQYQATASFRQGDDTAAGEAFSSEPQPPEPPLADGQEPRD